MLYQGQKIRLASRGSDRFGVVETVLPVGAILRLYDGSSAFVQTTRRYRRGDCIPFGLFMVYSVN